MGNIMWGIVFLLAGVVLVWLGIRQRKRAQRDYEDDVRRYTASTVMTVVHLDESVLETGRIGMTAAASCGGKRCTSPPTSTR